MSRESEQGRRRVVIEAVRPEIDGGRFPVKRCAGERVVVECDAFADGHDDVRCVLLYRRQGAAEWTEAPMTPLVNDRWRGEFTASELGVYEYTFEAWVDHFRTWQRQLKKRIEAGQDVAAELLVGARLIESARDRAVGVDAKRLHEWAGRLRESGRGTDATALALDDELAGVGDRYPERRFATTYEKQLAVVVDRARARFGAWYELFPRSWAREPGRHGTFRDLESRLEYVASMGFDVLYLAPIHPIGRTHRKGKNNAIVAGPDDPGSPWGIGSAEGGHKAVHPQLGTLDDFRRLIARAKSFGLEVALDIAFQCSADHPYAKNHSEWFRRRPDGSIQYAENPPKKYQDIYPLDFESNHWPELWREMKSVVQFWIDQGVRIFRVDNPHTKPFAFWEWLIGEVKKKFPDVIFLSEAFTRPKVMYRLAKLGFTQSYTYFAWRNAKWELTQYFTELTQTDVREYFRANLWPNTPDILTEYLQRGGRPAFAARFVLAATLGASYGIYGPAFELCVNRPREPGSEEYLDSEKYEIKRWDLTSPASLRELIGRVNRIRRDNPPLQSDWGLAFHHTDNDQLICYSKTSDDATGAILVVVNLDPTRTQAGFVDVSLEKLGIERSRPWEVHDLLTDTRYAWHGSRNYVELNPARAPAHIFRVSRRNPVAG